VTAAVFGWRAAQIGSTAAYDDRQSISETVAVQQAKIQTAVEVAAEAQEYERYRADYTVAAALDREADRLAANGDVGLAAVSRGEAAALREGATRRAAAAGVFGRFTIGTDLLRPTAKPRSFDYKARAQALATEQSTGLDSPASLNPARWAAAAVHIRARMNDLTHWALLSIAAVLLYTVAEVTTRPWVAWTTLACGFAVYLAALVGALSTVFFSA
jgi:hypothetical protein